MLVYAKQRILALVQAAHGPGAGLTIAALKVMQRVILVQSRGVSDPRVAIHFFRLTTNILGIDCIYSPSLFNAMHPFCWAPAYSCRTEPTLVSRFARLTIPS